MILRCNICKRHLRNTYKPTLDVRKNILSWSCDCSIFAPQLDYFRHILLNYKVYIVQPLNSFRLEGTASTHTSIINGKTDTILYTGRYYEPDKDFPIVDLVNFINKILQMKAFL